MFIVTSTANQSKGKNWLQTNWFCVLSTTIIVLAILSRFILLDAKPFHHDESLHAYYSHIIATGGARDYDPLLHGPFLYYFVGFIQFLASLFGLGESAFVARFPAALFGVLVVASPLLIKNLISKSATLMMMFLFLISPTSMYFGRFLREDVFTSIWVIGAVFGLFLCVTSSDKETWLGFDLPFKNYKKLALSKRTITAIFSAAMLSFHFTNKENSFLHTGIWSMGIAGIFLLSKFNRNNVIQYKEQLVDKSQQKLRMILVPLVFSVIFVLFFSSFFRHTGNWWDGVIDGLYRKSLVYWWGQDQVRRIDGPFDYHLPILLNYEFVVLPFLIFAWLRILKWFNKTYLVFVFSALALILITFLLPRIPLVGEAYSVIGIDNAGTLKNCSGESKPLACALHISHTRHLLQMITYVYLGGLAFWASVFVGKYFDAFLWFWLTGAIGAYSYVGEKVPWLTVYLVIPLVIIAALEFGRIFAGKDYPAYELFKNSSANIWYCSGKWLKRFVILWLIIAVPFTCYKAIKVSFVNPANPEERLVFTQTTPAVQIIAERWEVAARLASAHNVSIGMTGESTWPIAWYAQKYSGFDFFNGKDTASTITDILGKSKHFDVIFINDEKVDLVQKNFMDYNIYRINLRAWWVPKPNPELIDMFRYFFTGVIYPVDKQTKLVKPDHEAGKGATRVLYLEYVGNNSVFENLPKIPGFELVQEGKK